MYAVCRQRDGELRAVANDGGGDDQVGTAKPGGVDGDGERSSRIDGAFDRTRRVEPTESSQSSDGVQSQKGQRAEAATPHPHTQRAAARGNLERAGRAVTEPRRCCEIGF